jgi:RNA polymerase sigma-70 factor, ECF subfamily
MLVWPAAGIFILFRPENLAIRLHLLPLYLTGFLLRSVLFPFVSAKRENGPMQQFPSNHINMLRKPISDYPDHDMETVLSACIAGNHQAQRFLFKKFFSYSKSICLRYTSCNEEAEDVLNEGFLKVFNNLKTYDPTYPFKAWLRTLMVNTAISYNRKYKKHRDCRAELDDAPELGIAEDIVGDITAEEILELVQQLRPAYRDVFLMHVVDGFNHREIAQMLDLNEATVRSNFARARGQLKLLVEESFRLPAGIYKPAAHLNDPKMVSMSDF